MADSKLIECKNVTKVLVEPDFRFSSIDLYIVKSDHPKFTAGKYLFIFDRMYVEKEGYEVKILTTEFPMDIHEVKDGQVKIYKQEVAPIEEVKDFVSTIQTNLSPEELEKYSKSCQEVIGEVEKMKKIFDASEFHELQGKR